MGKLIVRIYKYDQRNWPYPPPNTTFVIPQFYDTYIKNQHKSASIASVYSHYLESSGLDQSTNHHGNTDVKDNNDSQ